MEDLLLYKIALTLVPGVGDVNGKRLVSYCGGVREVFHEKRSMLEKIPGVGSALSAGILKKDYLVMAGRQLEFIKKNGIRPLFYLDQEYPKRLKHCEDGPMLLYVKGKASLSEKYVLGVVGTRKPSSYGQETTQQLIHDFSGFEILIISGLAYGIDTCAHRACLASGLPTVAVLAHGLDTIYPFANIQLAEKIMASGALVTEFPSGTKLNKDYFPRRNRILAGLCDAVLVVESAGKGGALITADIAQSYNRDVFALPGRTTDPKSSGCNKLIKYNKAALVESAEDIRQFMRWDQQLQVASVQKSMFQELSDEELKIMECLPEEAETDIDTIYLGSGFAPSKVAALLLKMEFKGLVACKPGNRYRRA